MARSQYDIEQIAIRLLGEPNLHLSHGSDLRFGKKGSLSVNIDKGVFHDFETGEGGGPLQLIIHLNEAANRAEAKRWLLDQGVAEPVIRVRATKDVEPAKGSDKARALFAAAGPIAGTPVATYLRRRAIDPVLGQALRFHRAVFNKEAAKPLPALLAPITRLDRPDYLIGVHRTWVTEDGKKAAVPSPKKIMGAVSGGGVALAKFTDSIIVGEGVETSLSASAIFGLPGIAALGASNMRRLDVPATVSRVVIAFDQDANGAGRHAAESLAGRIWMPGRRIEFAAPPRGFKDFNDAAQAAAKGARSDE